MNLRVGPGGPFAWTRAVHASALPCLTVWISEAPPSKQPPPTTEPHQLTAQQRPVRGCMLVWTQHWGQLWTARSSCHQQRQTPGTVFTHLSTSSPPLLKDEVCRSVRVCLAILAVSVCRRRLLNHQWIILLCIELTPEALCTDGSHSKLFELVTANVVKKEKRKTQKTALVTVCDVVRVWFTRVWFF